MTTKFIHFRRYTPRGELSCRGGVTVAYRRTGDCEVEFAVSRASPEDNYSRYLGRLISEGRLNKKPFGRVLFAPGDDQHAEEKNIINAIRGVLGARLYQ